MKRNVVNTAQGASFNEDHKLQSAEGSRGFEQICLIKKVFEVSSSRKAVGNHRYLI
jgi:hypothetical protein